MRLPRERSEERRDWRPLSRDEERRLSALVRGADPSAAARAREQLVLENLRLVRKIAQRFHPRELSPDDLFQEGVIGLMRAAELFDGRRGFKFSTYAHNWIIQAIQNAIEKTDSPMRVSTHASDYRRLIKLEAELGNSPCAIATALGLSTALVEGVLRAELPIVRLDAAVAHGSNASLGDLVACSRPSPEDVAVALIELRSLASSGGPETLLEIATTIAC